RPFPALRRGDRSALRSRRAARVLAPARRRARRGGAGVRWTSLAMLAASSFALTACNNMANQPKLNPYELPVGSQIDWPVKPVPRTVARDDALHAPSPPPVTMALLERGRQRFDVYCSPCHSRLGDGRGMIVQRGFPHPPSYYDAVVRS